jgi:hypothetical protein
MTKMIRGKCKYSGRQKYFQKKESEELKTKLT